MARDSGTSHAEAGVARGAFALLAGLIATGCAATFTDIERAADGTYTLTRIQQGFFSVNSKVFRCTERADGFLCKPLN